MEDQLVEARNQLTEALANADPAQPSGSAWIEQALQAVDTAASACAAKWSDLDALKAKYDEAEKPLRAKAAMAMFDEIRVDADIKEAVRKARVKEAVELALRESQDDEEAASWDGVNLTPFLDGSAPEAAPVALQREDGQALFYTGYNTVFGDSTTGKSLICAEAARQQILAGRVVLWLDFEEADPGTLVARLLSMGLTPGQIKAGLHFVRPASGTSAASMRRAAAGALKLCGAQGPEQVGLIVVDSVGESLALEGLSMDRDADFGPWAGRVKLLTREFPVAALIVVDHGKKGTDETSKFFPSGTFRKIATVTGAAWLAETVQPFSKDHAGTVKLLCAKDRHGLYRRKDTGTLIRVTPASLSGPGGQLKVQVCVPGAPPASVAGSASDWPAVEAVLALLSKNASGSLSTHQIEVGVTGIGNTRKRQALTYLIQVGAVSRTTTGTGHQHTFVRALTVEKKAVFSGVKS